MYAALFAATLVLCLLPLYVSGKSMIWSVDGLEQAYAWFLAIGDWLRHSLGAVFANQTPDLSFWNPNWGYGSDQYVSLAMFLFDPFFLVSAITPHSISELVFQLTIVVRLFLAGLAFSWYARYRGNVFSGILVGSLAYVFSAAGMVCLQQGFLLNGFIFFPLVLLGAEWALEKKSPALLVLALGWAFMVQFYVSYVVVILLIPYCLVRYRSMYGSFKTTHFLACFVRVALYCVLGIALSGAAMLPVAVSMFGMDRIGLERAVPFIYDLPYYAEMFKGFISYFEMQGDAWYGFGPLGFVCLVLLTLRRKQYRTLFVFTIALLAFHFIPFVCSLFNGLQYPGNRWIFITDFCLAYVAVRLLPELPQLSKGDKRVLLICACIYGALVFVYPFTGPVQAFFVAFAILLIMVIILWMGEGKGVKWMSARFIPLILVAAVANYWIFISPLGGNKVSGQTDARNALASHMDISTALVEGSDSAEQGRVDSPTSPRNNGLVVDVPEMSFYSSLYSSGIDRFHTGLGLVSADLNYSFYGLDSRYGLETLLGVRFYALGSTAEKEEVPYSFKEQQGSGGLLYETDDALPLAFVYNESIPKSDYDAMDMVAKQESLLQAVVLEDDGVLPKADVEAWGSDVPFSVTHRAINGEVVEDHGERTFFVRNSGETLEFEFSGKADAETYLMFTGMSCSYLAPTDRYSSETWQTLNPLDKNLARIQQLNEFDNGRFSLNIASDDVYSRINFYASNSALYGGKKDWACNLGYSENGKTRATVTFDKPGIYSFSDIDVVSLPVAPQKSALSSLRDTGAQSIEYQGNVLAVRATSIGDGILFVSVPYSAGWSVLVDDKPADVVRTNVAFLGVFLDSGSHEVIFSYETPGLRQGVFLSVFSTVVLVWVLVAKRLGKKRRLTSRTPI